jgi:hypothetical protein
MKGIYYSLWDYLIIGINYDITVQATIMSEGTKVPDHRMVSCPVIEYFQHQEYTVAQLQPELNAWHMCFKFCWCPPPPQIFKYAQRILRLHQMSEGDIWKSALSKLTDFKSQVFAGSLESRNAGILPIFKNQVIKQEFPVQTATICR